MISIKNRQRLLIVSFISAIMCSWAPSNASWPLTEEEKEELKVLRTASNILFPPITIETPIIKKGKITCVMEVFVRDYPLPSAQRQAKSMVKSMVSKYLPEDLKKKVSIDIDPFSLHEEISLDRWILERISILDAKEKATRKRGIKISSYDL